MTFMANDRVENGVPQGQILKSKEPYHVVPQMKALDKHFQDLLKFWRYDVIWWRNDMKSFVKKTPKYTSSQCKSIHDRMQGPESMHVWLGNLSQCMPECGEGFCKILLALWATWFICLFVCFFVFFVCNHWFSDSCLTQQALHLYNISCIDVSQWQPTHWWHHFKVKVKGQGH